MKKNMKFIIIIALVLIGMILANIFGLRRRIEASPNWKVATTIAITYVLANITLVSYVLIKKKVSIPILIINIMAVPCCMYFEIINGTIIPWESITYTTGFCSVIALLKRIILDPILALIRKIKGKNNPSCMQ
jgi:hypothetical protein